MISLKMKFCPTKNDCHRVKSKHVYSRTLVRFPTVNFALNSPKFSLKNFWKISEKKKNQQCNVSQGGEVVETLSQMMEAENGGAKFHNLYQTAHKELFERTLSLCSFVEDLLLALHVLYSILFVFKLGITRCFLFFSHSWALCLVC